ncbi:MAG: PGN_0703 family putative restriction endonuclease [Chthoniobacterales bacterium]
MRAVIDPQTFIQTKQTCWALRNGLRVANRSRGRGIEKNYVTNVNANLFMPLSNSTRVAFEAAQGNELESKMLALASSAALAVNLFSYWNEIQEVSTVARLLGVPRPETASGIKFESIHPIFEGSATSPNLDAEILTAGDGKRVFIECKFVEPYRDATKPLRQTYFDSNVFDSLPSCRAVAERTLSDQRPKRFNTSQALTHIFGLMKTCKGKSKFRLIYLWYNIPGSTGVQHAEEVQAFAREAGKDGINFETLTVQDFLVNATALRNKHPKYVDYISDRYF